MRCMIIARVPGEKYNYKGISPLSIIALNGTGVDLEDIQTNRIIYKSYDELIGFGTTG